MAETLFTNVRILDGSGQMPWIGAVFVQGNRIKPVGRTPSLVSAFGATVIDAAGATLMPGVPDGGILGEVGAPMTLLFLAAVRPPHANRAARRPAAMARAAARSGAFAPGCR